MIDMGARERVSRYRQQGGGADWVRVEVLVPADGREQVIALAADLREAHRQRRERLAAMVEHALALYRTRIAENIDLGRLPELRQRAAVVAGALMDRGDARAFVLGRAIMAELAQDTVHGPD